MEMMEQNENHTAETLAVMFDNISEEDIIYPEEEMLSYPESEKFSLELDYLEDKKQEEKLWQARTGLNLDSLCGAIETVIFMNDRPVSLAKIKSLIDEDMALRVLHEAIARLQNEYEQTHHGLRLSEVAEGYQFRTKATYSKYVQDLFKVNSLLLTPTALEVLAIIAYKQPVSKVEVEKIRGVDSSHIVRGLMDKRLVKVCGRSDEMGRPVLYGTTPEFLEVFNLADIGQLPPEHELADMSEQTVGKIADIKTICSGDKTRFSFDEIEELDRLAEEIKTISADTHFTKSLKVEDKRRTNPEGVAIKSAFDLLEEFLDTELISSANKESCESELVGIPFPQVITDLEVGPFNEPELDEEFEMIDLETGEAILEQMKEFAMELSGEDNDRIEEVDAEQAALEAALIAEASDEDLPEIIESIDEKDRKAQEDREQEDPFDIFNVGEGEDGATVLADALEAAFKNLTGENLLAGSDDEKVEGIDELSDALDYKSSEIAKQGEDLDLDLSFLTGEFSEDKEGPSSLD